MKSFDVIVMGSGPGGYVAAIRASQLGKKVAIIESDKLGGVCLNRGCIPTKAVLKSAHSVHEAKDDFKGLGINIEIKSLDGSQAVKRAKDISDKISKGVGFLMKKNKIEVFEGTGKLKSKTQIEVKSPKGHTDTLEAKNIILATGAHYRTFPGLEHDGKRLIGAWEAIKLEELPKSIGIIGAGAIGVEFAYFWNAFGVDVHIFEMQKNLLPIEDTDSSVEVEKAYKKYGIKMSLGITDVKAKNNGKDVTISCMEAGQKKEYKFEMGLIAVGMTGNIENNGFEAVGIKTERGFIAVNDMYQTSVPNIYAIGDVSGPPLLAHAASHEGVVAAEHLAGLHPHKIDKMNIAGCTYCQPQVASVGYTERALKEKGIEYKVGKLPFTANGKAVASNETVGFVKTLMGKHGEMLGAHIVGAQATELIHEYALFRTMEGIDEEIFATIHPHPTLGEWLAESVLASKGRALNF
ncbi:MAG: dihydrolipoyl dehydrogenase [Bdellovibrio sp. CG12_big_fil_rev_8_21_14_0_65_39_13]|nr:MAG: dihydrolipoyl dehydrogenase [Bdellovibrio sp. CG22_combo_CG10-13_8_21_14_all_39_27]PIQ58990.1 MAG: dihydrolipoyl dehydrogenase [Bdellovibrio sp. CG12_big_fil_rev_8_21_14_0_65_39_13]PIR33957.1 MAG: dihydrolipoyl dehydrogenase [Bdellovibrio sp. CG11_big_fil_rev_8_21_14_0_20_39_38]PJB52939.1 MAG: dihydrolipoyl dehydrogenase [Bdellovibrio sp. CG_4_9_14_3_um_filter_39_7]